MSQVIHLINEYPGIIDLSAVSDVTGKRVVLQPKGMNGSDRECFAEVEEHAHVITMVKAGRLSIRREAAPAPTPAKETPKAVAPHPVSVPEVVAAPTPVPEPPAVIVTPAPEPELEPEPLPPPPAMDVPTKDNALPEGKSKKSKFRQ